MKKCERCRIEKPLNYFNRDESQTSGRSRYCRKCQRERDGISNELTVKERTIFLEYIFNRHKETGFIVRNPDAKTKEEAQPITLREMAADTGVQYFELQSIFHKLVRLDLVTLITQSDGDGGSNTLIYYKEKNIRRYFKEVNT